MNNNVNMAGMNAMGGPVGGGMPMMNNGAAPGPRAPMQGNLGDQRSQLNTYIYEYFLRNGMYDCARSLLKSEQPINILKDSPGRRRDESNGAGDEGGDGESKDDMDSQRPPDLPDPNLPKECPESCFLYEWWCLFWDMFNAQRGKGQGPNILQYVSHTQAQSRVRQEQQQVMLQGLRNNMVPNPARYNQMINQQNQDALRQKAMQNTRNATPQQQMMLLQQQKMQRDPSDGNNQQRAQSPGSAENAPSPSKRPRLDPTPFNPQQVPNGRGQGGIPQQFQNMPGNPNQQNRISNYQANLVQQQQGQMGANVKPMPNPGGPPSQNSPMMQGPDGGAIANYYNPGQIGANGLRAEPGGQGAGTGNHALQDYQMQLMLLEQQNKKRLMMARQEQDNMMTPREGAGPGVPGPVGPNGQPFQQGTSPQGPRSVNSPNPGEQMKRGTPHMNPAGMPSPIPAEGQNRGSPSGSMNFNMQGGQIDPNMNPQFYKMNGMDPNMVGGMPNNMRPPSSHPGNFNGQMTPQQQQMVMARAQQQQAAQQQQQQQAAAVQNWQQGGPNGPMIQQPPQGGAPQQGMGTPQQRAMPPPPAVASGPAANGRTQPSSPQQNPAPPTPQQANKANPKKKNDSKDNKAKRAAKKGSAAINAGATPSAEAENAGATPTPATPSTPVHPKSFNQNGAVQVPIANGQPPAPAANTGVPQQPDPLQGGAFGLSDTYDFQTNMDFANPNNGNMDVLQDFDFDSFLHQDGEGVSDFTFDGSAFMDGGEIGAE